VTAPYTADWLLEEVRRGASAPSAAATDAADADFLAHADAELRDTIVPLLLGVQEEYYQRAFDTAVVADVGSYRINKRAALSRINWVQFIQPGTNGARRTLERIEPKRTLEMSVITAAGQPWAYYLEGGRLVLYPTPTMAGTLRVRAMVRPGRLALLAATGSIAATVVTGAASTSFVLTVTGHAYTTATPLDVVAATPSFEYLAMDALPSAVSAGTTVTVAGSSFSSDPAVGDYVCAPDSSPFVQLPVELQPALVELVVARWLRARGLLAEAKSHADEAERMVGIGIAALTPRVDTAARKLVGGPHFRKRGFGLLRGF